MKRVISDFLRSTACLMLCLGITLLSGCVSGSSASVEASGIVYERFESETDPLFYARWPKKPPRSFSLDAPNAVGASDGVFYLTVPHDDDYLLIEFSPDTGQHRAIGLFPASDISYAAGRIWYRTGKGIFSCTSDRKDIRLEISKEDADDLRILPAENGKMLLQRIYRVKHPDEERLLILETISIHDIESGEETILQEKGSSWNIHFWDGETMVYSIGTGEKKGTLYLFSQNEHILLDQLEHGALVQVVHSGDELIWYSSLPAVRQLILNRYHPDSGEIQTIEPDGLVHDLGLMFVSGRKLLLFYTSHLSRLYAFELDTEEVNTVFTGRDYSFIKNELLISGDSYHYLLSEDDHFVVENGFLNDN